MNPFRTGKLVLFQVSYDRAWHYFEVFFYVIIGVFGGLYGAFVIKYNMQMQAFRRAHLSAYGVSEAVTLAVLTAVVAYPNKFLRIDMSESLEILFRECEGGGDYAGLCQTSEQWKMVNSLLLATALRFALVVLSYGAKVPAGIFIPSMAIGATFGRMVGILVKALHTAAPQAKLFSACHPDVPCITPGTYAFLGAAAGLAGATRITVAVVVIMFELTGALTYILPTMIVVMITKGVADWIKPGGISDQSIRLNGYPFLEESEPQEWEDTEVQAAMTTRPACLYAGGWETVSSIESKLREGDYKGWPVVESPQDATLVGYIGRTELRYALAKAKRDRTVAPDAAVNLSLASSSQRRSGAAHHLPEPITEDTRNRERHRARQAAPPEREGLMRDAEQADDDVTEEEQDQEDEGDNEIFKKSQGPGPSETISAQRGRGISEGILVARRVDLGAWLDTTRLTVAPVMPLAVVKDLFIKLGPRVILVVDRGKLVGLVTIKDLLKFSLAQERAAAQMTRVVAPGLESESLPGPGLGQPYLAVRPEAVALGAQANENPSGARPARDGPEHQTEWEGVVTDALTWGQGVYHRLRSRWGGRRDESATVLSGATASHGGVLGAGAAPRGEAVIFDARSSADEGGGAAVRDSEGRESFPLTCPISRTWRDPRGGQQAEAAGGGGGGQLCARRRRSWRYDGCHGTRAGRVDA